MKTSVNQSPAPPRIGFRDYPLLDALMNRRSRRFGKGFHLNGGPLQYQSQATPEPLSIEEEAALAFAACGITGHALADVPFESGAASEASGGNMLTHLVGRTVASPDSIHAVTVFVINDDGAWMLKRPQDFPRDAIAGVVDATRRGELVDLYLRSRVQLADRRIDVPRAFPFLLPLNKWSANQPGSTYFLPVGEYTAFTIDVLLTAFDEEWAMFALDDHNRYQPAGLSRFGRSRRGHLDDDPRGDRIATITALEASIAEMVAVEMGAIVQNLGLMTQALGLGGFPHYAGHQFAWFDALGFQFEQPPISHVAGLGRLMSWALKLQGNDTPVPTAIGLERGGNVLIKPWCPPWYRDMADAVQAFVAYKFEPVSGTFRDGGAASYWKDGAAVQHGIPRPSDRAIDATIAFCDYVYRRYGRFPIGNGPFRSVVAYQAHRLDESFYDRFYRKEALADIAIR